MQTKPLPSQHIIQGEDTDNCGPCSLVMVYALFGQTVSLEQVQKEMNLGEKGESTYPPQLARNLMRHGHRTKLVIPIRLSYLLRGQQIPGKS